jgi:hypothetical protein
MNKSIIFLLIFLISCHNNNENRLKKFICNNDKGYWNYEWPRKRADYYGFTFKFNCDGSVTKYSFSKIKKTRRKFIDNHYPGYSKWSINNDSVLVLFDTNFKLTKVLKDTIYCIEIESKEKVKFIRVVENLNIID